MATSLMNRFWGAPKPEEQLPETSREVYLQERPVGSITPATFATRSVPLPDATKLSPTQCLVRVLYVSVDPAMRGWLSTRKSYVAPVGIGCKMRAMALGIIVRDGASHNAKNVGEIVLGLFGWCEYTIFETGKLTFARRFPNAIPKTAMLGVLGTTGLTAYFGLLHVGKIRRGEVVVVSAAAGATGSVAAQIARIYGCVVVGIAGGVDKCRYLENELKIGAVDYKSEEGVNEGLNRVLKGRAIDVYFDNVGGDILEACLRRLNRNGRVVLCGGISGYNSTSMPSGPRNYLSLIAKRGSMTGFLVYDFEKEFGTAYAHLTKWLGNGKLTAREDEVVGLEQAPMALQRLFEGRNVGKVIVRVADDGDVLCGKRAAGDDVKVTNGVQSKL